MAEDIRNQHPEVQLVSQQNLRLAEECARQEEACTYSAASLYIWHKRARLWRSIFLISPVVLSGFATSQLFLDGGAYGKLLAATAGLLAGLFPAIFIALNMDMHVEDILRSAAEFTNIRDRFRQAGSISSFSPFKEFKANFDALMDRLDSARASSPPAPEWCFRQAQRKIKKGDYVYEVDKDT